MYGLHLTNFMPMPVSLNSIDVLTRMRTCPAIATFEVAQLETMLQPLGGRRYPNLKIGSLSRMARARSPMSVAFDRGSHIPDRLRHRVATSYAPERAQ
jgi:hypothetical protein